MANLAQYIKERGSGPVYVRGQPKVYIPILTVILTLARKVGVEMASLSGIARGLYRYGPSGAIYLCRKVSGKNVWRSLQTNDRTRAMAISSLQNYVSVQNGNHELITFPERVSPSPERQINLVFEGAPATAPTVRSAAYFGCRGRDCWYNFFL